MPVLLANPPPNLVHYQTTTISSTSWMNQWRSSYLEEIIWGWMCGPIPFFISLPLLNSIKYFPPRTVYPLFRLLTFPLRLSSLEQEVISEFSAHVGFVPVFLEHLG